MIKFLVGFCILAIAVPSAFASKCDVFEGQIPTEWINMTNGCIHKMRTQIQTEIDASYQYLAMAAHFSRDTVNRPGFAELFFKSAREEREHGSKLIEYLSMRGKFGTKSPLKVSDLIKTPNIEKFDWKNGEDALEDALRLEIKVTKSIRALIETCENDCVKPCDKANCEKKCESVNNDYHLVDYLTGVYLEEQLHGQRELAGKLSTLKKLMNLNGELGEFLFDKEL